jgi:murein DD-endopeptidase MepM/ murein hydrolase activator NlpD
MDLSALESAIDALEKSLDSLEFWLTFWTALVVIGLVVEYWHDVADLITTKPFDWKKFQTIIGGILITAGVAGELSIQFKAASVEGKLRTASHQVEALLNKEAEDARSAAESAKTTAKGFEQNIAGANARARTAEAQVASANAASRDAVAKVSTAEARISEAQRSAAESKKEAARLTKEAEAEHLARVRLEQQLSWRSVTSRQGERIARRLLPFSGQQFDFVTYGSEGECLNFENELYRIVLSGRWVLDPKRQWAMLAGLIVGVEVQVPDNADAHTKEAASTLVDALTAEDVLATVKMIPAQDAPNPAVIKIAVGKNPNSMRPIEAP